MPSEGRSNSNELYFSRPDDFLIHWNSLPVNKIVFVATQATNSLIRLPKSKNCEAGNMVLRERFTSMRVPAFWLLEVRSLAS
jgi:hypothetical protein